MAGELRPVRTLRPRRPCHAIAVTLTGFAIAGAGYFWRVILEFFAAISRKFVDQARSLEKTEQLRRVA